MKTKIVIWGTNEKEAKILLGIELIEAENKIKIFVFPEAEATEDFYNQLINDWRIGNPVVFPENHTIIDRPLSVTESLLPDDIKTTRSDIVNRAKAEWHFVVLSSKLYQLYQGELSEIKEKVNNLEAFDKNIWDELKVFWQKVQSQVYDKNLFREHAKELQDGTNAMFDKLKKFRKKFDEKFKEESKENALIFNEKLDAIRKKVTDGLGLQPLWNELKTIQSKFKNESLTKTERNEIWNKIDGLFKDIKEKKYGSKGGGQSNALERIENRYKGLLSAISKMQNSIKWDKKDMKFQNDRAEGTFGQLEKELRGAKMKMIEERVNSKEVKLAEMNKTKAMLEDKIAAERAKIAKIEEAKKIKEKEVELKAKVKLEIQAKNQLLKEKMGDIGRSPGTEKVVLPVEIVEDKDDRSIVEEVKEVAKDPVGSVKTEELDSKVKQEDKKKDQPLKKEKVDATITEKVVLPVEIVEDKDDRSIEEKVDEIAGDPVYSGKTEEIEANVKQEDKEKDQPLKKEKVDATITEKIVNPVEIVEEEDDRSISEKVIDVAEDAVDSVKAAGKVIGDRISKVIDNITEEE